MVDGFYGLRHDAVVCGHNQHHKVGYFRTARTHGRKRLMPGGVQKCDPSLGGVNMIGTNVLGNPTGFVLGYPGFTDHIQQGRFTVVNMSHDRYHRRSFLQFLRIIGDLL